jgi:hypothetical protein
MERGSDVSTVMTVARSAPAVALMAAATSSPRRRSRQASTTWAPSDARRTAIARPKPDVVPVTTTRLFSIHDMAPSIMSVTLGP